MSASVQEAVCFLSFIILFMVRKYNWYDPVLVKRLRVLLTVLVWTVWLMIAFLQHDHLVKLVHILSGY